MRKSFDEWMKKRDKRLYENLKSEGFFDGWFGGSKKAEPAKAAPVPQKAPNSGMPSTAKMDGLLAQVKNSMTALGQHINTSYGHNPQSQQLIQNIKQSFDQGIKPVAKWWHGVKQYTADVLRSGGPEALQKMQADDKLSRTLHRGMKDYQKDPRLGSEFNAALDPRRQPARGYVGNNNDSTVKSLLQQGQSNYAAGGDGVQLTDKDLVKPSGPVMAAGSARRAVPMAKFVSR